MTSTNATTLLMATRFNARSVTWPSAFSSCATSITTAGEVETPIAAATAA